MPIMENMEIINLLVLPFLPCVTDYVPPKTKFLPTWLKKNWKIVCKLIAREIYDSHGTTKQNCTSKKGTINPARENSQQWFNDIIVNLHQRYSTYFYNDSTCKNGNKRQNIMNTVQFSHDIHFEALDHTWGGGGQEKLK